MFYEYEYRLEILISNSECLKALLQKFPEKTYYIVKYAKCFRSKNGGPWEMKKKLRQTMVYHPESFNWLKFVESKEIPFNRWKVENYKQFKIHVAFRQHTFEIEHRWEIKLDEKAKLYGYKKKNSEFGFVFELEVCNNLIRCQNLPISICDLNQYADILTLFCNQTPLPYILHKCRRKSVKTTNKEIKNSLKALKFDGIFGHVYSYKTYIFEQWEDGRQNLIENQSLGDGFVYGAERLEDQIILLYVVQVRGVGVYNVYDILLNYLKTIPTDSRYNVQIYYPGKIPPKLDLRSDGIIYHTQRDKIFKLKPKNTIDLLYENGFFVTKEGLIQCCERHLENGTVYECDLDFTVIRPRYDRFVSNSPEQLKRIFRCNNKQLKYTFHFKKSLLQMV